VILAGVDIAPQRELGRAEPMPRVKSIHLLARIAAQASFGEVCISQTGRPE